jgi:hypothetical protein
MNVKIAEFIRRIWSKRDKTGATINPGESRTIKCGYEFIADIGFPENPVLGQIYKHDGFYVEFEDDKGGKYKKQFSQEFVFVGGGQWVQEQGQENITIDVGGEYDRG